MLGCGAIAVYALVLGTHALRRRAGLTYFYALLGALTVIVSWVTDAGIQVTGSNITFMVGSTVFYTSILLGVFVVYVFDGPSATRVAIATVAGVSILIPLIAYLLHALLPGVDPSAMARIPRPSLRINAASVAATIADLLFLAMAWEFLGTLRLHVRLAIRAFLTLLGVMWLDVLLFSTGAFAGTPGYVAIMQGTLLSRLFISVPASLLLYAYLFWQNRTLGKSIEYRPVMTILREVARVRAELGHAQEEIARRKAAEQEKEALIRKLEAALTQVRRLEGLLPVCASCRRIRVESHDAQAPDRWMPLEEYIRTETDTQFSHGMCEECLRRLHPDLPEHVIREASRRDPEP